MALATGWGSPNIPAASSTDYGTRMLAKGDKKFPLGIIGLRQAEVFARNLALPTQEIIS